MRRKELVKYVILMGFVLAVSCSTVQAIGLGVSPASFTVPDALKGGEYERTITAFNTADDEGDFELSATGPGSEWITFYSAEDPETPVTSIHIKGHDKQRILVRIKIAEDTANMAYTPTIYVQSVPPELEGAEGAVAQAVLRMPVRATIQVTGTQILKGTVKSIRTANTEIDYPLKIKVGFENEGNVIARPKIEVAVTKAGGGELVDSFVYVHETGIKPDKTDTITVKWNTTGRATGDYAANVAVSLGEELLATKELPFKVLPFGTLTRQGVLHSLTIEGEPLVNIVIKPVANFENTGEIDTMAKFKGEIYYEGNLLEVLESDEMFVEVGETGKLTDYYKITEAGSYAIKGRVFYSGKETAEKEVSFDVPEPEVESSEEEKKGIPGFEAVLALIAMILVFIVRKRRDS